MTTRLPTLRATELIPALEKEGFKIMRQKGSHVCPIGPCRWSGCNRAAPARSRYSRGLLRKILRDAELSRDEFIALLK